ncbi:hypothetical protein P9112_001494 [Eukaryota sp. TZLM1-RC]
MISIEDGKTPYYQVTSDDPEERYRGFPARLRTASYLEMAAYYNPDCRYLPCPCQVGHGFHYCPGEARFSEVVDDNYYTEIGNRNRLLISMILCSTARSDSAYPLRFQDLPVPSKPDLPLFSHRNLLQPSCHRHSTFLRLLSATALRPKADPFAVLNSLKHFSSLDRRDIDNIHHGTSLIILFSPLTYAYKLIENESLTLPINEFLRCGILNPSQRSPIPLSRYSLQFHDEIYEEVLHSPFLSSRSWSDADIEHDLEMQELMGDENAGLSIPCYVPLPISGVSTNSHQPMQLYYISSTFIPEYLMYPYNVYMYHYHNDGNACPHPVVTYQYGHREDHNSPAMIQLLTPVPTGYFLSQELHSCNLCPHVNTIRRSLLDELTIDNYIRIAEPLDTITYNYKFAFYDREQEAEVLPRSLPDGIYSKEMFSLIPFQDPDLSSELACSVVNVTTRSQIPREVTEEDTQEVVAESITSEATSSDYIAQNPVHSPAEAFLRKIFHEQQKLPDDDELFSGCICNEKTGLKLTPSKKVLIPHSMVPEILNHIFGSTEAGHPSFTNSWKTLKNSDFYWPTMKADMELYISASGSLSRSRRPFEYLHCDTIGPFSPDSNSNKYVLHFVDAFTKYSILVPVADIKAITVAEAIITRVYAIFGAPQAIHSDNGTEFSNAIFACLCQLLNISHSTSIPHFH